MSQIGEKVWEVLLAAEPLLGPSLVNDFRRRHLENALRELQDEARGAECIHKAEGGG